MQEVRFFSESAMTCNTTTPAAVTSTAGSTEDIKPKNKYPIQMVQFNDIIKKLNTQLEYDRLLQEEQVRRITTETDKFFKGLFIQSKKDPDGSSDNSSFGSSSCSESNSTNSITAKSSTKTGTEVMSDKGTKKAKFVTDMAAAKDKKRTRNSYILEFYMHSLLFVYLKKLCF